MTGRLLRWGVAGIGGMVVLAVAWLAALGIPKPPSLATEDVPRLRWGYVLENLELIRAGLKGRAFGGWMPDGESMFVWAPWRIVDQRVRALEEPGGELRFLSPVPRNAVIHSRPGRDHVVLRWDEGGDERYQLHRWDLGDTEPVRLTDGEERAFFQAFEPDGPDIVFSSTRRNGTDYDLYRLDPTRPGSEERILETEGSWSVHEWSPTDDVLIVEHTLSALEDRVYLLDLATRELTLVSDTTGERVSHGAVRWTGDGRGLFLVSDRGTEFRHLRHLDPATGEERILTGEIPWDVQAVQRSGDGSFLILTVNEDGRSRFYRHDVPSGRTRPLELFETGLVRSATLHPERPVLAVNHADMLGVTRAYTHDLETGETTLWAGAEAARSEVPETRLVHYPTFDTVDGEPRTISAFVYPGIGEGARPVVVDIHGGPESQARLTTGHLPLQRKGITVVTPNVRGSTGYGKTFTSLDDGYLREDAVRDVGALLDWIAERADLDEERVLVTGGSYGGYMVLASLVHFGERLRCGVDVVGISNFVTFLENTADYRRDLRRAEYGDERDPEMRAFLHAISPLTHAERIVSPLLVVQGANDPRVPATESRQLIERAREAGGSVRYIEAADEGHGFRKPWNSIYAGIAELQMTDACLGTPRPWL